MTKLTRRDALATMASLVALPAMAGVASAAVLNVSPEKTFMSELLLADDEEIVAEISAPSNFNVGKWLVDIPDSAVNEDDPPLCVPILTLRINQSVQRIQCTDGFYYAVGRYQSCVIGLAPADWDKVWQSKPPCDRVDVRRVRVPVVGSHTVDIVGDCCDYRKISDDLYALAIVRYSTPGYRSAPDDYDHKAIIEEAFRQDS